MFTESCPSCDFVANKPTQGGARKSIAVHMRMKHHTLRNGQIAKPRRKYTRSIGLEVAEPAEKPSYEELERRYKQTTREKQTLVSIMQRMLMEMAGDNI